MGCDRRFLIVFNPTAGSGRGARVATAVDKRLRAAAYDSSIVATAGPGDAQRITIDALAAHIGDHSLCVVACGGDGTVQDIANAMAGSENSRGVLGLMPTGRCNDFARSLGIASDPQLATDVLIGGTPRRVDLGRAGGRYFCTVAAIGFDAAVSRFVNEMHMPLRGPLAYVYGTFRTLFRYRTPVLRLRGDFGEYGGPVFIAACANTPTYGGAMKIAPDADVHDGLIDICLVTRIAKRRVLRLLPRVMAGSHPTLPEVQMLRSRSVLVSLQDPSSRIEVWADGEPIGRLPITVESAPEALNVMLPDPALPK